MVPGRSVVPTDSGCLMKSILLTCLCGKEYLLKEATWGREAKCSRCERRFAVPVPNEHGRVAQMRCAHCQEVVDVPEPCATGSVTCHCGLTLVVPAVVDVDPDTPRDERYRQARRQANRTTNERTAESDPVIEVQRPDASSEEVLTPPPPPWLVRKRTSGKNAGNTAGPAGRRSKSESGPSRLAKPTTKSGQKSPPPRKQSKSSTKDVAAPTPPRPPAKDVTTPPPPRPPAKDVAAPPPPIPSTEDSFAPPPVAPPPVASADSGFAPPAPPVTIDASPEDGFAPPPPPPPSKRRAASAVRWESGRQALSGKRIGTVAGAIAAVVVLGLVVYIVAGPSGNLKDLEIGTGEWRVQKRGHTKVALVMSFPIVNNTKYDIRIEPTRSDPFQITSSPKPEQDAASRELERMFSEMTEEPEFEPDPDAGFFESLFGEAMSRAAANKKKAAPDKVCHVQVAHPNANNETWFGIQLNEGDATDENVLPDKDRSIMLRYAPLSPWTIPAGGKSYVHVTSAEGRPGPSELKTRTTHDQIRIRARFVEDDVKLTDQIMKMTSETWKMWEDPAAGS